MQDKVTTVSTREEWKKELSRMGFLKALGQVWLVGKEKGMITPYEVMNEWTMVFALSDSGEINILELKQ